MGGKTQQRVAGNAKPTSSGRIRDLMINKQQGVGNIITFSALANNNSLKTKLAKTQSPIKFVDESAKLDEIEEKPVQSNLDETPAGEQSELVPSSSSTTETNQQLKTPTKQTLIVRRIGNRDYFTRIRLPHDAELMADDRAVELNSGVKMDKNSERSTLDDNLDQKESEKEEKTQESDTNEEYEDVSDSDNEIVDDIFDFDKLLEELSKIHDDCERRGNKTSLDLFNESDLKQECELMRLFKISIRNFKEELSIEEWDAIVRSIYKWCNLITKTNEELLLSNNFWSEFCKGVFSFIDQLITLAKFWNENLKNETELEKFPMMELLLNNWNNFHSSNVYQDLIILYFKLISKLSSVELERGNAAIIEGLAKIIIEVDPNVLITNSVLKDYLSTEIEFDPEFKLPKDCKYCDINANRFKGFIPISGLFKNNQRVVIVTAHSMLSKVIFSLGQNVYESLKRDLDDMDNVSLLPPAILTSILTSKDLIMSALLSDYKVGDISVTIEPNTDAYTCTLSYLFVWDLIIQFIVALNKEDQHRIIHSLKKLGLIQRLLDNIFMLLPPLGEKDSLRFDVVKRSRRKSDIDQMVDQKPWSLIDFLRSPLATNLRRPKNEIELIALHLYFSVALHMPVTVRKWYNNNSHKRLCNLVNEYTVKHISQVICSLEMETVQEKCQERANDDKFNNLIIKARPNAREVYAIYTRDEFKMELTIKLPINYPLGSVQIDGGKRVGVTDLKWRSWLLQLTTFLSHQNGPILDGIDLWRKNIDKRFEGIEKCMICFSILHSNYQLPKKKCMTCTKMFHNLCLYKWFESSGNSTCPLCRNTW